MSINTLRLLTLITFVSRYLADKWTLESLYDYMAPHINTINVYDAAKYLAPETTSSIQRSIDNILISRKIKTYLVILDSIDDSYWSWYLFKIDIVRFTEELIFKLYPNINDRDNSLFIVYSINDKVYRFRTGEIVRVILPDRNLEYLANDLKWYLKGKRYDAAFIKLFEDLFKPVNYFWTYVCVVGIVIFIIIACVQSSNNNKRLSRATQLKQKYKTLEELKNDDNDINLFIQETCIICLEKLDNQLKNTRSDNDPLKEVFLDCGHNYHSGCLNDWLDKSDKCPLCRHIVDNSTRTGSDLLHCALFDIQRRRYQNYFTIVEIDNIITSVDGNIWRNYDRQTGYNGIFTRDRGAGGTWDSW